MATNRDDASTPRFSRENPPPQQFNTPHCVAGAADGLVYVCDRGNQRIQVFDSDGAFITERVIEAPLGAGRIGGTPWDLAFSRDPEQRLLYVVDGGSHAVHTLSRDSLDGRSHVWPTRAVGRPVRVAAQSGGRLPGESVRW